MRYVIKLHCKIEYNVDTKHLVKKKHAMHIDLHANYIRIKFAQLPFLSAMHLQPMQCIYNRVYLNKIIALKITNSYASENFDF